jgi:hypothetical protein
LSFRLGPTPRLFRGRAIDAHTPQQIEELYVWLDQRHPQPIDAQLKADLDAGRIDDRINRALADHKA